MYKTSAGRSGGSHHTAVTAVTQAEYIAASLLSQRPNRTMDAMELLRKLRSRVTLRYFTWEAPGAHSYRHGGLTNA